MLVPLIATFPPPRAADTISSPGATMSGLGARSGPGPRDEKRAVVSARVVAPTARAPRAIAGSPIVNGRPLLPAATTTVVPSASSASTALENASSGSPP